MPLSAGTRIGPYEIAGAIGAGGMGEVYRARDTRLGRDVAIKALPDDTGLDADRIARFHREAQILATLNHPHIAALYGLEEVSTGDRPAPSRFLILELVAGGTLADRLQRGPLPPREAMTVARQLADALQAAHDKGIIHRDLKPGNVALTPDGLVKVLDFGIAKMRVPRDEEVTVTRDATEQGAVIGTAAYMSPEQARGLPLDKRSDIWSFGCVFYEALIGAAPFRAATASDTVAAILGREPDFTRLPSATPPRIVWLLRRCLEKDTKRRLHDIGDARIEIDDALDARSDAADAAQPVTRGIAWRERLVWMAMVIGLAGVFLAWNLTRRPNPHESDVGVVVRSSVVLPASVRLLVGEDPSARFALSPDGLRLAIVASIGSAEPQLYLRPIDGVVPQPLAGTEGALHPFWSPDSRSIAFISRPAADGLAGARTKLRRIDLATGQVATVAEVTLSSGATWNRDGVILFTPRGTAAIHRVSTSTGASSPVTTLDEANGDVQHARPFFLPDGNHFLFTIIGSRTAGATTTRGVFLASLDGKTPPRLVLDGVPGAQYADGHLLFVRDGRLMALSFDIERLQPAGDPLLLAEGVQGTAGTGGAFSVSNNGVVAYQAVQLARMQLAWFDRQGARHSLLGGEADYSDVVLSRDGSRAAVGMLDASSGTRDIWVFDVGRGTRERLTSDPADDFAPVWSPQGDRLAFSSMRRGREELFVIRSNAPGTESPIATPGVDVGTFAATWSPVDDLLVFVAGHRILARSDLWAVGISGKPEPFALLQSPSVETQPRLSPDGRWLAYAGNASSRLEVYVQPFPGSGPGLRVSVDGGRYPVWKHDGSEIFFLATDDTLMAATIRLTGTTADVGAIRPLFRFQFRRIRLDAYPYDVARDGRFLVNTVLEETAPASISLLQNWPGALATATKPR